MICGITMAICFLHWPQWGGMFCGPKVRHDGSHQLNFCSRSCVFEPACPADWLQPLPHQPAEIDMKHILGMQAGVTEEDYYYAEYTAKEREEGLHLAAMKFVSLNQWQLSGQQHSMFTPLQMSPAPC